MKSLNLLRVFGFKVTLNHTWFIGFGLITWSLSGGYFPLHYPGFGSSDYWVAGLFTAVLLFLSVLLHELSHAFVARRQGVEVEEVTLYLFGGVSRLRGESHSPLDELRMAVSGPLTSFVLFVLLFFLTKLLLPLRSFLFFGLIECLSLVNLMLALFNIIPAFPLDGGRVLRAVLWTIWKDLKRATRVSSRIGKLFAIGFILLGVYLVIRRKIFSGMWLAFLGLFLRSSSEESYRETLRMIFLSGVRIRDVMTSEVFTVSSDLSVDRLVECFLKKKHIVFPVVDGGRVVGLVTPKAVGDLPRGEWTKKKVSDVMVSLDGSNSVGPDDDAFWVFRRMVEGGGGRFVVVSGERLLGMVTRSDIMRCLEIRERLS